MGEQVTERTGFLFDGTIDEIDPSTARITEIEEARQVNKLIMIASESAAPPAVREALASVFTDLYAEGYPAAHTSHEPESLLADVPYQLAYHERYSDRRFYKGTELADLVEALAQHRIRHLFAPNRYPHNAAQLGPEQIQANVQPLSGANANTAVYNALLQPGDTIMGLNLSHGGHLTHGSPANISGKLFKVVPYGVNPATGRIDYDEVERLAQQHQPRMIVTGASAYPWGIDFARLRKICDALPRKAYLLADVSHPAGLVVAGLFPNPVGVADVTTFTTHKTLIGPRAAVILTTSETLARRIDRAVFPGLQGGPHMNTIAALAVAFKIAETPAFADLQQTIVKNARALAETLERRGLTIAYGGTDTHLLLVDLKPLPKASGVLLNGDVAARILDLAGVVCNKNTIADDSSALYPTGIRLGTPWITQRGLTPDDMRTLGGVIADVLHGIVTFSYFEPNESAARGKVSVSVLRAAQQAIAELVQRRTVGPAEPADWRPPTTNPVELDGYALLSLTGRRARSFLDQATDGDIWGLQSSQATRATVRNASGQPIAEIGILRLGAGLLGLERFVLAVDPSRVAEMVWWLEALSSGLVLFDPSDPWAKVAGPVAVTAHRTALSPSEVEALRAAMSQPARPPELSKPYFVGQRALAQELPEAAGWNADTAVRSPATLKSPISDIADSERAPGGWTMPRQYVDSKTELHSLREAAGLVDESGLGILEISGADAARFLDLVTTNDIAFLAPNAAQYTFVLDSNGQVLGDALLFRPEPNRFLLTTAPTASSPIATWLQAAAAGAALDRQVSTRVFAGAVSIRDRRTEATADALVVLGIAGPNAPAVLRAVADSPDDRRKVGRVRRFTTAPVRLAGVAVLLARTGHTGQAQQFEAFVPAAQAKALWQAILARGAEHGIQPVGWDAWHAAGIAAGLPTDGHEVAGLLGISPVATGFGPEVKPYKPFFVGRAPLLAEPYPPLRQVVRFQSNGQASSISPGDALLDASRRCVGNVTSVATVGEVVGLGYVTSSAAAAGATLGVVHSAPSGLDLTIGTLVPEDVSTAVVTVLSRFPK
jgi:glycine hydroxymethyltransferase